jgi:hypothetical protein
MSEQPSKNGTGFAAAFAAMLSLFGILPTGNLATAQTTPPAGRTDGLNDPSAGSPKSTRPAPQQNSR